MRNLFLLFVLCFASFNIANAQVYNGDVRLFNQAQVDAFNYTEIKGNLMIAGGMTNLNSLSKLQKVEGNIDITGTTNLINLEGLNTLSEVSGYISITRNNNLTSLSGLSGLESVGSSLAVDQNPLLMDLSGLSNLNSVTNNIAINSNPLLSECCAIKSLLTVGTVGGSINIYNNKTNCNSKDEILNVCTSTSTSNNALSFDGTDDFIELGNSQFYKESFTVEGWIKPQQNSKDKTGAIFHARFNVRFTAIYAEVMSNGKIRFFVRNPPHNAGGAFIIGNKNVLDGNWHHFAAVKGDDDKLRLYIDGELDGTSIGSIRDFPETTGHELLLGTNWAGSTRYFKGQMDEIRLWDRARTLDEIKDNKDKVLTGNQPGLVTYYNFNQGIADGDNNGMTILDDSKGTLNGTLKNFQLSSSTSNFSTGAPVNN